jgi:hypothetical protein
MNTNWDDRLDALLRAVRAAAPDTSRAEYGFETRLLARLREERGSSVVAWAWKLAPLCAALAAAAGLWRSSTSAQVDTDAKVIAEASRRGEERMLMAFMTGERR